LWKAWRLALDHLAPDSCFIPQLGDWFEHHHQHSEWLLDAGQITLFHHSNGIWKKHAVNNRARLRLSNQSSACARPAQATHMVETETRTRFVEITSKCNITRRPSLDRSPLVPYTSTIGCCIRALPRYKKRFIGDIPTLRTPSGWDLIIPVNISITTDRSVTLGIGNHSWIVTTEKEDNLCKVADQMMAICFSCNLIDHS
jgi:hypothetical protein